MNIFVALAVTGILVGIIIAGMKIASTGINPSNRTYVFEFMKDLAIVAIVFFNLSTLYTLVFGVNYTIVDVFGASYESDLIELKENVDGGDDILGDIIIGLCLLGLSIWANFYYMMRKLTLIIFMIMGPLMIAFYLIPQLKSMTMGWAKEFIGTVFVQSIHAALYWIVALMATSTVGIESVILYIIFIPTAEAVRSLLGLGGGMTGGLAKTGAMFGMAGLAGMYGATKGALGGKSVMGALKGAYSGAKDRMQGKGDSDNPDKTVGANAGTDIGSTSRAEKMLKAGEITSKVGKAVLGSAGAIAGSVTGPTGSMIGSTAGFIVGGAAGGIAGRGGAFVAGQMNKGFKAGKKSFADGMNADKLADEKVANEIASSETAAWADENKHSFMKNMKEKFPDAHESSLQSMWDKKVDSKRLENLEKAKETVGQIRKNDGKYANAQSLATTTADNMTADWAKHNKQQYEDQFNKANPITPNMTNDQLKEREMLKNKGWQETVARKKNEFSQVANETAEKMSNGLDTNNAYINKDDFANAVAEKTLNSRNKKYANAQSLATTTADNMTAEWAKNNKQQYMDQFNKENPITSNMTEDQIQNRERRLNEGWDKTVANKQSQFKEVANDTARSMSRGIDPSESYINKDEFAQTVAAKTMDSSTNKYANAQSLATITADNMTAEWAKNNRQQYIDNFNKENPITPNMTDDQIQKREIRMNQGWNNAVANKRSELGEITIDTARSMSDGLEPNNSYIDKDSFAESVANKTFSGNDRSNKTSHLQHVKQAGQSVEVDQDAHLQHVKQAGQSVGGDQRSHLQHVKQAGKGATVGKLHNYKSSNTDYLASQMASIQTGKDKEKYISDQVSNHNVSEDVATQNWAKMEPNQYQSNLKNISNSMPKQISLDRFRLPTNNSFLNKSAGAALGAVTGTITGAATATGISGIKQVGGFLADTKIGKMATAGAHGLNQAVYDTVQAPREEKLVTAFDGVTQAVQGVKITAQTKHIPQNVVEKQEGFRNSISYATGILGGVTGYQAASRFTTKLNPYNKAVNNQVAEVSDISHMAQQVDDGEGNMRIASGAVQMVTTGDQSYIQVRDKTGNTQIVSRMGRGDSYLKKGEVVYQDLDVQEGALIHNSAPYKLDSAGGKIMTNRQINVDPGKLVANRNTPKNPRVIQEVQAYNQQVDSGTWTSDDVIQQTQDIRMVVTKERSYMVAQDTSGNSYRVSPYGEGDARLEQGEIRQVNCKVNNRRILTDKVVDQNNKEVEYYSSLQPKDLLPAKENKRSARRRNYEKLRHKSLGGTV